MSWLRRIERAFEPFAVPHLTLWLVAGQTFLYLMAFLGQLNPMRFVLVPALVMQGEVWRLVTFLFDPPAAHWALVAFVLYFLYFTGNTLEEQWGRVRFNLFILVGYVLTVAFAFITPGAVATNIFIGGSIFLAFAYLHPDFVMYLFFVLPVKIKWLALLAWIGYGWSFFTGGLSTKLSVVAAVGNFFLFFGHDLWISAKAGRRRMGEQAKKLSEDADSREPRHRCLVCGKNSNTNPELDFRYCSKCAGDQCYCPDHIQNHTHVLTDEPPKG